MRCLEVVVIGDVRDADDQNPHPATSTVNDTGRDVNERTFGDGLFDPIENDAAVAIENIVELGGTLVVMELGAVNVHSMSPGCWR
jgi:hypothetical protein